MPDFGSVVTIATIALLLSVLISDRLRPVFAFLGALGVLFLLQIISPQEALSGFANPVIATLALLFIVNKAVEKTGILTDAVRFIRTEKSFRFESVLILVLMLPVALFSSILNNTPIVLLLVPAVKSWGQKHGVASSKLLIPLSYAAIIGGMWTIIGTSTNLLINDLYTSFSGSGLLFFEPAVIGIPLTVAGIIYMSTIGHRTLPRYQEPSARILARTEQYLIELLVPRGSALAGMGIEEAGFRDLAGVYLAQIFRGERVIEAPGPADDIREGDRLVFAGNVEAAEELAKEKHLIPGDSRSFKQDTRDLQNKLVELVVRDDAAIAGKTIKQASFRSRYGGAVVAVHRRGQQLTGRLGDIRLKNGDNLLVLITPERLPALGRTPDFYMINRERDVAILKPWQRYLIYIGTIVMIGLSALSTMGFVLGIGGQPMGLLHFSAILVAILFASKSISVQEIRQSIRFDLLLIIASAIGIAVALENTGIAGRIGERLFFLTRVFNPLGVLAVVYIITNIITEVITNNAAAVLLFPIVMSVAEVIGIDSRAMVMVLIVAAGSSFSTPMGYQTNLIVQSAAGYKFKDFIKAGLPMNVIAFLITIAAVDILYL
jgi:di/tricarboxylate transporter